MIDQVKNRIETLGFSQLVEGNTHFWINTSSLIDHCWTDCPNRILKIKNENRASSDHNAIQISESESQEPVRNRKRFL